MGGVAAQRLCYQAWGPCGPPRAPSGRVQGIGRPLAAPRGKTDPTSGPGEAHTASCPSVHSFSPMLRSLPLGYRAEGPFSPSRAFPRPPWGRIAASRRQRLACPDFSTAPPPLPACFLRARIGPGVRVIHCALHLEVRTSPLPLPARSAVGRWRPLPGHRARAPWGQRAAGQRVENMEPNPEQGARASHRSSPLFLNRGQRAATLLSRHAWAGARPRA